MAYTPTCLHAKETIWRCHPERCIPDALDYVVPDHLCGHWREQHAIPEMTGRHHDAGCSLKGTYRGKTVGKRGAKADADLVKAGACGVGKKFDHR